MATVPTMDVAHDARAIADELISEHHVHLLTANILYVFTDQRRKKCDRVRLGSASKLSSLQRFLASGMDGVEHGPDFIILIDSVLWAGLDRKARRALIDHELCFPIGTSVSGPPAEASSIRWYAGELVEIRTAAGHLLAGTPNHPVLTPHGWMPLGLLNEGSYVVSSRSPERVAATVDPNEYQMPASIEDVARARRVTFGTVPQPAHDLNANIFNSEVDVVPTDRALLSGYIAPRTQQRGELVFGRRDRVDVCLASKSELGHSGFGMSLSTPRVMRRGNERSALLNRQLSRTVALPVAPVPNINASLTQQAIDDTSADSGRFLQTIRGLTPDVALDEITRIRRIAFTGHVYNLQTTRQWYIANGVVVHNCHCALFVKDDTERPASWLRWVPGGGMRDPQEYDEQRWGMRGHDIEEFGEVLFRHGFWKPDGPEHQFGEIVAMQLKLPDQHNGTKAHTT